MASALTLIDGTNVQLLDNLLKFSHPRPNPGGGKVINVLNKHTNQPLNVTTPVITTWGAKEGLDQNKNPNGKWSVSLQFPSSDYPNPEADKFLEFVKKFEQEVRAAALQNSLDWLAINKADAIPQVINFMFNAMLKYPKVAKGKPELDFTKAPSLPSKLPEWKSGWQVEVYDELLNPLFIKSDNGKEGASPLKHLSGKVLNAKYILQPTVWIANGKVSITWSVVQALVKKQQSARIPEGVCMLALSDEDKTALDTKGTPTIDPDDEEMVPVTISATVDDSEDEETIVTKVIEPVKPPSVQIAVAPTPVPEEPKKKPKIVKKNPQ
jgi:hypothetical protein